MPFCTQCGGQVGTADQFCGACGTRQGTTTQTPPPSSPYSASFAGAANTATASTEDFLKNVDPRTASLLCYIPFVGWIAAIVVLASNRFRDDKTVRFHAFQGLYLFVTWLFVDWVFAPAVSFAEGTRFLARGLKLVVFGTSIWMLIKTSQNILFRLPFLGELADRSVSEQK